MVVSPHGVNDLADFFKCVYQVRTLTELWDVTLSIKIKNAVVFGSPNNEFFKKN